MKKRERHTGGFRECALFDGSKFGVLNVTFKKRNMLLCL